MQIAVFEITQYFTLSIFLGISITFGYDIINSKKLKNISKIILGYILPMIILPFLYYYICNINGKFSDQEKLIYFGIINTAVFILLSFKNYRKKENKI